MKLTAKYLLVAMLACTTGAVQANYENEYMGQSRDGCCFSSCYECGCNPLYCGAWDLQIQGGVEPILWRNRKPVWGFSCVNGVAVISNIFNETPKFNSLFKIPWTVGGQIGYHWSDNARVYVEFDYFQAKGKDNVINADADFTSFNFHFAKYKAFEAYVGARYYWDRWCDRVAFFLGGKVGLIRHQKVVTNGFVSVPVITLADGTEFFHSNTVVSGGADFGFDVCFCGNWSFVVTGSVLASSGPSPIAGATIAFSEPVAGFNGIIFNNIGSELRFPVTAGIRYSF